MGVATAAGAVLYVGTTASVTATDTFLAVGEVVSIAKFGRVYNKIDHKPLSDRGVQKYKGGYNEGDPVVSLGKDIVDVGQAQMLVALADDADYNFKIVANDDVAPSVATVTVTIAAPGIFTDTAHGLAANTPVKFTTTGALPTGLVAGTTYYVKTVVSVDTYSVSATAGGSAITTTGTQSGVHTRTTVPAGSIQYFKAKVFSWEYGYEGAESIVGAVTMLGIKSGTLAETGRNPAA